ncbi:MAG: permease-like cell division protein FtsX [bacterium]|nr:permease-like cell division protein FtsX [bacterium]
MLVTHVRRILRNGLINFWRNPVVSLASLLVMAVTIFIINSLIISSAVFDATLTEIKDKVDINVYFTVNAPEDDILLLKESLEGLPEVTRIEYISREVALENFTTRHANSSLIIQSLQEIGDNPLGASLNIKAQDPSHYESIALFLEEETVLSDTSGPPIIEKVNFKENREVIARLANITSSAERIGLAAVVLFAILAVIVTVNTIRLAIYTAREEISVMRLVGARNNYIRGPFMVSGVLYGVFAGLLVMAVLYPVLSYVGTTTGTFLGTLNVFDYYLDNFFYLLLISIATGVLLGVFSSMLAVRKYLNV